MTSLGELELSSPPAKLKLRIPVSPSSPEINEEEEKEEECHTPTSNESKIPAFSICPLAPKKTLKFSEFRKKRRFSEVELIRVSSDLMERLFRPREDPITAPLVLMKRKRCYPG